MATKKSNSTKKVQKEVKTNNIKKEVKTSTKKKSVEKKPTVKKEVKPVKIETVKEEIKVEVKEVKKEKKPINKKLIIGIAAGAVIIIVLVVLSITVFFNKERIITNKVKKMAYEYYSEYYYDSLKEGRKKEDFEKIMAKFSGIGFKISLDNIVNIKNGKYNEEVESLGSKKKKCDKLNTRAIIYPEKPYGKKDYRIEVELDCGF
jgi:hypothetical protein